MTIQCICNKRYNIYTIPCEFIPDEFTKEKFYYPYIKDGKRLVKFTCDNCKRSFELDVE